eukprot:6212142-Pleurochrysis_carterae.AAC.1
MRAALVRKSSPGRSTSGEGTHGPGLHGIQPRVGEASLGEDNGAAEGPEYPEGAFHVRAVPSAPEQQRRRFEFVHSRSRLLRRKLGLYGGQRSGKRRVGGVRVGQWGGVEALNEVEGSFGSEEESVPEEPSESEADLPPVSPKAN